VLPARDISRCGGLHSRLGKSDEKPAVAEQFAKDGIAALVYDNAAPGSQAVNTRATRASAKRTSPCWRTTPCPACGACPLSLIEGDTGRIAGISQAGWIAPLAAERSDLANSWCCGAARSAR
jgi:hypothetical protein